VAKQTSKYYSYRLVLLCDLTKNIQDVTVHDFVISASQLTKEATRGSSTKLWAY